MLLHHAALSPARSVPSEPGAWSVNEIGPCTTVVDRIDSTNLNAAKA